jgi:hypothetical protein
MWDNFLRFVTDLKLMAGTVVTMAGLIYGSYEGVSHFFVTRAEAASLAQEFRNILDPIQKRTIDNSIMIIENRLIILEQKKARGEELTTTEKLQYDRLKEQYKNIER